jgi:hypothetical protein
MNTNEQTTDLINHLAAVQMVAARRAAAQTEPMIMAARAALGNEEIRFSAEHHPARRARPVTAFNPAAQDGVFVWGGLRFAVLSLIAATILAVLA